MSLIRIRVWPGWSVSGSRPLFNVVLDYSSDAGLAAQLLKEELERASREIDEILGGGQGGPEDYNKHILQALVFLAAARAGVNPAHIDFTYIGDSLLGDEDSLRWMFRSLVSEFFDPIYNLMNEFVAEVRRARAAGELDATAWEDLARFLDDLNTRVEQFKARMKALHAREIAAIYRRAAEEASDHDVRELAQFFAEIIDKARKLTSKLEYSIEILESMGEHRGKDEAWSELVKTVDEAREIVSNVNTLITRAEQTIDRLKERDALLEENIRRSQKKRLKASA